MNTNLPVVVLKGLATYVPGLYRLRQSRGTSEPNWSRYCYSVWLRHLVMAWKHGFTRIPESIAELGPGPSLGAGLAAMLSGADTYSGLDVVALVDHTQDLRILDELVELYRRREAIPGPEEFPLVGPLMDSYEFPRHILTDALMERTLSDDRIEAIRAALRRPETPPNSRISIGYFAPWYDPAVVRHESVDMVFSQGVLQSVDELDGTYKAMRDWLKPGGLTSHQIALYSLGTASAWNGHYAYSDWLWRLIRGKRAYLINREPCSTHLAYLRKHGFRVITEIRVKKPSDIPRRRLAKRFRNLSEDDFTTAGAFIQAIKEPLQ